MTRRLMEGALTPECGPVGPPAPVRLEPLGNPNQTNQETNMGNELHPSQQALVRFFEYAHLPEDLQRISRPFHELAAQLCDLAVANQMKPDAEFTTALRKLLEAKDCAVRAAVAAR